jgi:hypothetical protein
MSNEARAAELFAAGESVNGVAKALGITWAAAKKLQQDGGTSPETAPKRRGGRKKAEAEAVEETADEELPEIWDLQVEVPRRKTALLFAQFDANEQAQAVQFVLQQRMDALLAVGD